MIPRQCESYGSSKGLASFPSKGVSFLSCLPNVFGMWRTLPFAFSYLSTFFDHFSLAPSLAFRNPGLLCELLDCMDPFY